MKKSTAAAAKTSRTVRVSEMVEDIVGSQWSLAVLSAIRSGVHGPAELEQACPGISTKVLNERLRKMLRFGILEREETGDTPPRVEYRLTGLGGRFVRLIDDVDELQRAVDTGMVEMRRSSRKGRAPTR